MSMTPKAPETTENTTEVNLDNEPESQEEAPGIPADDFEALFSDDEVEEKAEKIKEAFGIDEVDPQTPAEETEEDEEIETPEEEKKPEEEPEKPEEKPEPKLDWESEENIYKKKFSDSAREVNEVLLPAKKERDTLLAEKEEWTQEKSEINAILKSDPELLNAFLVKAQEWERLNPRPVKPAPVDEEVVRKEVEKVLGPDYLERVNAEKAEKEALRVKAIQDFEAAHPGLTPDDRGKLATHAAILEAVDKLPLSEALERSFVATFPEKALESERKRLEEEARVRAAKRDTKTVTTTGASQSTGSKPVAPKLSAKEAKMAKAFGLTPDAIASDDDK